MHFAQMYKGILCFLVLTASVGWMIIRSSPSLLVQEMSEETEGAVQHFTEDERVRIYSRWFIAMRWIAVLLATMLVVVSVRFFGWLPSEVWWPLSLTVSALAASNILFMFLVCRGYVFHLLLPAQAYLDLIVLTVLLHFSGGIENPLSMAMIFHVTIAGILLSRRQCYLVGAAASTLFALLAWGEWSEVIEHYTLQLFPHFPDQSGELFHPAHHTLYVSSRVFLQAVVIFLTAYFVTTLAERLRRNERRLKATAERATAGQRLLEKVLVEQKQAQEQMMRAGKLAAVGELAGRVAHEVNNPIAIISAKARLLLADHSGEMSAKIAQELHKITDYADRVARTAQGLLSYCRPLSTTRVLLDIRQPIRKCLAMIEQHALKSGVAILDELPGDVPLVKGNAGELEQIFLNLFLNALDAMPKGGTLRISQNGSAMPDAWRPTIAIVVEDSGAGIPDAIHDKIFEPFFTTKQEGRGTGLGLPICLGLLRSHDGEIKVESEPCKGSRFTVRLPVAAAFLQPEESHAI